MKKDGDGFLKLKMNPLDLSVVLLIVATAGSVLQIGGTSWDITSHLLLLPETFFTPSHTLLYAGVGLLTVSSAIALHLFYKNKEMRKLPFTISFKLLAIGSAVSLVAGPSDYLWHEIFGIDGLLSPTHLTLITGMLINSISVVLGLARINVNLQATRQRRIVKASLFPAFAAMWFTMIWYTYAFALPFSDGEHFNFNLNPIAETAIAAVALPLISATVFVTASKTLGGYGASAVSAILVGLVTVTNILPSNQLMPFLPGYLSLVIIAIAADLVSNKSSSSSSAAVQLKTRILETEKSTLIAGAMVGSIFYVLGYPMLPTTFAVFMGYNDFDPVNEILPIFANTLPTVLPFTIIVGAIMGMVGAIISEKKIQSKLAVKYNNATDLV
ncbi:MAG TPA: hypothetical protein VER14_04410 [Phototrophicaceae bacterium]|nr:hypothetical protein [Phototrophicaceae bacterium]